MPHMHSVIIGTVFRFFFLVKNGSGMGAGNLVTNIASRDTAAIRMNNSEIRNEMRRKTTGK